MPWFLCTAIFWHRVNLIHIDNIVESFLTTYIYHVGSCHVLGLRVGMYHCLRRRVNPLIWLHVMMWLVKVSIYTPWTTTYLFYYTSTSFHFYSPSLMLRWPLGTELPPMCSWHHQLLTKHLPPPVVTGVYWNYTRIFFCSSDSYRDHQTFQMSFILPSISEVVVFYYLCGGHCSL